EREVRRLHRLQPVKRRVGFRLDQDVLPEPGEAQDSAVEADHAFLVDFDRTEPGGLNDHGKLLGDRFSFLSASFVASRTTLFWASLLNCRSADRVVSCMSYRSFHVQNVNKYVDHCKKSSRLRLFVVCATSMLAW